MVRRKRDKNWISWLLIIILFIAAIVVCSMVYKNYFGDNKEKETESKIEPKEEKNEDKEEERKTENEPEEQGGVVKKEEIPQYDGEDPNNSEEITGAITYTGVNGDYLTIRVNIDQYLSGGECTLRVQEYGSDIYSDSAGLINSASTMTCEGFDVPILAIGGGDFKLIIEIKADGKSGTIMGEASI